MDPIDAVVRSTPVLDRAVLVAVDGVDGSGKTTFAAELAARYADRQRTAHVVHLDDFLNPRAVRYRLGRDSPEGYFRDSYDLGTFLARVIEPLPMVVSAQAVVIVEGMFLHRDELVDLWDVSVFLDVPFEVSVRRMAERDGTSPDPHDPFVRRYVEGQRIYLARCMPAGRATHVVRNH